MESTAENALMDVLIVARDPMDPIHIRRSLGESEANYRIHYAADGLAALEYLEKTPTDSDNHRFPDLILMDLDLPKISGYQIVDCLRRNEHFRSIPLVVFDRKGDQSRVRGKYVLQAVQEPSQEHGKDYSPFLQVVASYLEKKA